MKNYLKIKWRKLIFILFNKDLLTGLKLTKPTDRLSLGNDLANWTIPSKLINSDSTCYLVGAGEDISFDLALAKKFNCKVVIIDPTPKAIEHFNELDRFGKISKDIRSNIIYVPYGLWKDDTKLKFFAPRNENHVSHSVVNLQNTKDFFEATVKKLTTLMRENFDEHLDLLKIDVEGAEYEIINSMIAEEKFPKILCIEYDEIFSPMDENATIRIKKSIQSLISVGYSIYNLDFPSNYTFVYKR